MEIYDFLKFLSDFSSIYQNLSGLNKYHSHNLALELTLSFGIPAASFTIFPILYLLYFSIKKIPKIKMGSNFIIERALIISLMVILTIHLVDIQYFDVRISTICWILLAGLRSYLKEDLEKKVITLNN